MMWLQSVPFAVSHPDELREAVVMAYALEASPSAKKNYDTFNKLITFLMGQPDNLSIPQVQAEVKKINMPLEALLNDQQKMAQLKDILEKIGNKQTRIRPKFEKTSHNKICLMPQRYQPDAEVLQTTVDNDNEVTLRATPKGLDFFAAMGVSAAEQILMDEKQEWKGFKPALESMKKRMSESELSIVRSCYYSIDILCSCYSINFTWKSYFKSRSTFIPKYGAEKKIVLPNGMTVEEATFQMRFIGTKLGIASQSISIGIDFYGIFSDLSGMWNENRGVTINPDVDIGGGVKK